MEEKNITIELLRQAEARRPKPTFMEKILDFLTGVDDTPPERILKETYRQHEELAHHVAKEETPNPEEYPKEHEGSSFSSAFPEHRAQSKSEKKLSGTGIEVLKKKKVVGSGRVEVTFVLPEDHPYGKVAVVGDFNGWDPLANRFVRRSNKTYTTSATVEAGKRYAFRYYCEDGSWVIDKDADAYEPSGFGSDNCILLT